MKKILVLAMIHVLWFNATAKEPMEKVMEKRAREMHRVIGLNDRDQWKKFIKENYTQALIDKPMRAAVQLDKSSTATPSAESKSADNLEAKVTMFQRLHVDFGNSKIVSIKPAGGKMQMVVDNAVGLHGIIQRTVD